MGCCLYGAHTLRTIGVYKCIVSRARRTHTCSGESDGAPPRAPERPERLPEEDLAGEPSAHTEQGKQLTVRVTGWQLYFYIGSLCAARDGGAPALDGTAGKYHL